MIPDYVPVRNSQSAVAFLGALIGPHTLVTNAHIPINWIGVEFEFVNGFKATCIGVKPVPGTDVYFLLLDRIVQGIAPAIISDLALTGQLILYTISDRTEHTGLCSYPYLNDEILVFDPGPASPPYIRPFIGCSGCPAWDQSGKLIGTWCTELTITLLPKFMPDIIDVLHPKLGDFNQDDKVDAADFDYWFEHLGLPRPSGGVYDAATFDEWFNEMKGK